ncbi:MAG TPA: helix-turn-helix domain-containing protein [Chloroflexota bacterium]|nr:helix-turn-helix domain-containing protein [Chloroflexota bacterium]
MSAGVSDPSEGQSASTTLPEGGRDATSLDRMARLRHLVRKEGKTAEDAAVEVGVDPIIAQLWLRLPDDLWPGMPAGDKPLSLAPRVPPAPAVPVSGLRRVITCRVPAPAYDRLRGGDAPLLEAAAAALETGLTLPRPEPAPGGWRFQRRPLAVPVKAEALEAITQLAKDSFNNDLREAAGWLIARGMGMAIPLPTAEELAGNFQVRIPTAPRQQPAPAAQARFVVPPRRRPEARAPLPPDDSAPNGEELRARREAVGISQRDLAAASGLSRGLVAEVERGRRRHVLTRLRISETLAALERS